MSVYKPTARIIGYCNRPKPCKTKTPLMLWAETKVGTMMRARSGKKVRCTGYEVWQNGRGAFFTLEDGTRLTTAKPL